MAIDELADYTDALKKDKSSSEMKALAAKIEKCLTEIAKKHRSQGIHLFVATQRPDASVISPGYRGQLSTVVSVWIPEKDGALIL